jgi:uncharacterized protein YjbJ (UPF0337 family)
LHSSANERDGAIRHDQACGFDLVPGAVQRRAVPAGITQPLRRQFVKIILDCAMCNFAQNATRQPAILNQIFRHVEKIMDKDRVVGSAKQIKGAVKQAVGKAVGDAKMESEGRADEIEGKVQNAIGGLKDALKSN